LDLSISAKVITDSVSEMGIRLTTMQLRYPRLIHAELLTHKVFSRNSSSSRAVPVSRLIEDVQRDPAKPVFWGKNQPGMQAREELDDLAKYRAEQMWEGAMWNAIRSAQALHEQGAHKQIVNRILEPFSHINTVLTSTSWANWYALRTHEDAQPEIKALADAMLVAQNESAPMLLKRGEWHLPYVHTVRHRASDDSEWEFDGYRVQTGAETWQAVSLETALEVSVARCARVSYLTHEGKHPSIESDLALHDRLMNSQPLHASPAEHQAMPDYIDDRAGFQWAMPHMHGNFTGWIQYRKFLKGEFVQDESITRLQNTIASLQQGETV
jgi:thymidylate synthase ThyX